MSRGLLFAAAGATIGSAFGMASLGWTIGSMLGAESQNTEGPRLDDLSVQTADYGTAIPKIYGKARTSGFVMWAKPLEEVAKTESAGGKGGGPTVTNYSYNATFAIAIAEGEIDGYIRIWANTDLIYSINAGSTLEEIIASTELADGITFYTGSETQEADPLIQADQGAANTQAYRGTAYLVFDRLPLENYGNRIPSISVEVSSDATSSGIRLVEQTVIEPSPTESTYPYLSRLSNLRNGMIDLNVARTQSGAAYVSNASVSVNGSITGEASTEVGVGLQAITVEGYKEPNTSSNRLNTSTFLDGINVHVSMTTYGTSSAALSSSQTLIGYGAMTTDTADGTTPAGATFQKGSFDSVLIDNGYSGKYVKGCIATQDQEYLYVFLSAVQSTWDLYVKFDKDKNIVEEGTLTTPISYLLCNRVCSTGDRAFMSIEPNNRYLWTVRMTSGSTMYAYCYELTGSDIVLVGTTSLNPTDPNNGFFGDCVAFNGGVVAGYTGDNNGYNLVSFTRLPYYTGATTTLSTIVSDILDTSGVTDYDVSALTDSVTGYVRTRQMTGRAAIEPLQQAFLFDSYEDGAQLVFTKRGGSSVVSIPEIDLGANSNYLIKHTRQEDSELPSKVVINHIDIDADYETGSQQYQRINANQDNVITLNLPIVMTASKAKQLAEILLFNAWTERDKFNLSLTRAYLAYNPTNVITVTANGATRIMRIVKMNSAPALELECVSEDAQVYSSDAVAAAGGFTAQTVGLKGPTLFYYLDIPMLRNQDNDEGVYIAGAGVFSSWTGAEIYKSSDSGATYSPVDNLFDAATTGYTTNTLADAGTSLIDTVSTVNVSLNSGSFSSITQAAMLNGGNYLLVGSEIVNFQNVTEESNGTYTLDTFIRGQRGTEWAASTHAAGERVVLLDENTLKRMSSAYNTARGYKAVSFGTYLDDAVAETNTNTGVSLKPFSPTFIQGSRDGSNNLTITWLRRSRYISSGFNTQPLLEETEYYKIEILDGVGGSVIATYYSTSESYSYTAAAQTSDGVTLGGPCYVKIYQNSDTVGYGYGKEEVL